MIPKKLDSETANELKKILGKLDIKKPRVTINFDNETIELEEDYSVDDLLSAAGSVTPERAKEIEAEIRKSREEWN